MTSLTEEEIQKRKRREAAHRAYEKRRRLELEIEGIFVSPNVEITQQRTGEVTASYSEKERASRKLSMDKFRAKQGPHIDELTGCATGRQIYTCAPPPGFRECPGVNLGFMRTRHLVPISEMAPRQAYCRKCKNDYAWWKRRDSNGELINGHVGKPSNLERKFKDSK